MCSSKVELQIDLERYTGKRVETKRLLQIQVLKQGGDIRKDMNAVMSEEGIRVDDGGEERHQSGRLEGRECEMV